MLFAAVFIVIGAVVPVSAVEILPPEVPSHVQNIMPKEPETFSLGLWHIVQQALPVIQPSIAEATKICLSLVAVSILTSLLSAMPGGVNRVTEIAGTICAGLLILRPSNALIHLGTETVAELSDYGKLLLPVMTAAMAAQGGVTTSAALYMGTAVFDAVLSGFISKLLVPLLLIFLCLNIAHSALNEGQLKKMGDFVKWLMVWGLKTVLYVFTGYMSITGVVSGTTDAAAVKAAKLTISGMVPVVGGILSDASESVLVGAGVMKAAVGMYGALALLAICAEPFIRIGIQYLMLKATGAVCEMFGSKPLTALIQNFSTAMGILLAMTGSVCLLLLISTVCFMKGVG